MKLSFRINDNLVTLKLMIYIYMYMYMYIYVIYIYMLIKMYSLEEYSQMVLS